MSASGTLAELLEEWFDDRRLGRGIADSTTAAYRQDLRVWAESICQAIGNDTRGKLLEQVRLSDLTPDTVRKAYGLIARRDYAPATRYRLLRSFRGFCRWLVRNELLLSDPTIHLVNPSIPKGLPVAFEHSELAAIVRVASTEDPDARYPWPARDRALVAVLAGAGLRSAEVCGLRVNDVMREEKPVLLRVTGKGNRQRRIPIASEVLQAVDDYLADCTARRRKVSPSDPLFVRYNYQPLSSRALNYIVCRLIDRAGVHKPEGAAAHAFRHTYAKGLVSAGVPLSSVQALLGHSSLTTTGIYLRMTGADLAQAVEAAEVRQYLRAPIEPKGA